ncbi:UNVERIFIED_CONTAM: hypothetical protein FKN15_061047 [Acipenser sinensis]
MDFKELIDRINRNTAAQKEQTKKWRQERGLPDPEPTELDLLLQKWEVVLPSRESRGEEPPLPESEGEELPPPEPEREELPSREPEEVRELPPPQPRPPPLETSPVLLGTVPYPLLLDTLPVCLDLPALDLEPRSLYHQPQFHTWFPTPLSPIIQTSLGCCQTSLKLPLFAALLPLGDRTSLHRSPVLRYYLAIGNAHNATQSTAATVKPEGYQTTDGILSKPHYSWNIEEHVCIHFTTKTSAA